MSPLGKRSFVAIAAGVLLVIALAAVAPTAAFHFLPPAWTGEAGRLATMLELAPGATVADIGAGHGDMAVEMARAVGASGVVYATELTPERRARISATARDAKLTQVRVIAAAERTTGLPDGCCDAIYLRNVLHHIGDPQTYTVELRRALKPGGRLAIIDFSPGVFLHLAQHHGITPEQTIALMTPAGFRLERREDDWGGRLFFVLFRS